MILVFFIFLLTATALNIKFGQTMNNLWLAASIMVGVLLTNLIRLADFDKIISIPNVYWHFSVFYLLNLLITVGLIRLNSSGGNAP
jgi:hypothetical protein